MTIARNAGRSRGPKLSFEFFPPRSEEAEQQLGETIDTLAAYRPDFVSVTYGAGGSTRGPTLATISRILSDTALPAAAHLTCVGATKAEVRAVVDEFRNNAFDFMQNLANPQIGGFFSVMRKGESRRSDAIVNAVRSRFATMHVVKWRMSCIAPALLPASNDCLAASDEYLFIFSR